MTAAAESTSAPVEVSPGRMRLVVAASAAGTVFEWYDFFVYGTIALIMKDNFFSGLPDAQALIFSLLAFSIALVVRPIGALVFGKVGDSLGRKGAFLVTISLMGLATFAIGCLPTQSQVSAGMFWLPAVLLISLRVLQGFALGGEYGGAAIYVAEHAHPKRRGAATSWIQCSAAIGLIGALGVVLAAQNYMSADAFRAWGWRIPYWVSIGLLAISLYIRLKLEESPAFRKLKDAGEHSKRPFADTFLDWRTVRIMALALFGLMMAQGVSWYCTHFYAPLFMKQTLGVTAKTVDYLTLVVVIISAPLYIFFAWLSDKVGRKPIMLGGMLLFTVATFPAFHTFTRATAPTLEAASFAAPAVVVADPRDCSVQFDLTGGANAFATSCDIAKSALTSAGVNYTFEAAEPGAQARVRIGYHGSLQAPSAVGQNLAGINAVRKDFGARLRAALTEAGYPAPTHQINFWLALGVMTVLIVAATMLYGPQAAALVELFPTRIRYTALSFPYNVGTGWFGGLLPPAVFAIATARGDIYAGLWYPVIVTGAAAILFLFLWPETKDRDIHAADAPARPHGAVNEALPNP
ncbi:MAG TPA: MFS transporter [Caulobacterales bacterium]|nr:MFS transporter [Caulobacterales bacterium]